MSYKHPILDHHHDAFLGTWPTIVEMFLLTANRFPNNRAFTSYSPYITEWTYTEVLARVMFIANKLHSLGAKPDTRIALCGKNSPEWACTYLAILYTGATVAPIDTGLTTEEIKNLCVQIDANIICTDYDRDTFEISHVFGLLQTQENYLYQDYEPLDLKQIDAIKVHLKPFQPKENDIAMILFTSGTTGNSKGVMLSHTNIVSNTLLAQKYIHLFETDVMYALLPLHHSYAITAVFMEGISLGSEIVFARNIILKEMMDDLNKGNINIIIGIPLLFNKMLKGLMKGIRAKGIILYFTIRACMVLCGFIKKYLHINLGRLLFKGLLKKIGLNKARLCISGGGPLASSTLIQFNQLGLNFVQGYGLTETSPIVSLLPGHSIKHASVGKILPTLEVKILNPDEDGQGEIAIRGVTVMQGYYNSPESTNMVIDQDGFFLSGDIGYIDQKNFLYLTGRAKSVIITEGGKNVFPEEIENAFQIYEEIEQILVRGFLKDKAMKQEGIEALVYPSQDFREKPNDFFDTIIQEVNRNLRSYQKIERVQLLVDPLPMTTTQKIKRFTSEI